MAGRDPRILTAGLHVNGSAGYVTGGLASRLGPAERAECALELRSLDEIETRLRDHIARGVDVVKIATTHGNLGFADAKPDLPEKWVREIVRVAHEHGLKVTAHSYGNEGDWAGAAYSVMTLLRDPALLHRTDDLVTNVEARVRRDLYLVLRLLRLPGVARLLMRHPDPLGKLESWYDDSLANTYKLYAAGVKLAFGADTPFAFGNFHHSVMNEARALRSAVLRMATAGSAKALEISDRVGTLQPGMSADCVLLRGDPLAGIEALSRVNLVLKEGRVVYRDTV